MGLELQILNYIQTLRTPFGDFIMPLISSLGNAGILWILLTIVMLIRPKTRKTGWILLAALLVDLIICNLCLKPLVARVRPYNVNRTVTLLVAPLKDYSFPSGHTAASFACVIALYLAGEKWLWKIALVISILIAFSRMYLYVHYPTDVLGGVIVGIFSGIIGYLIIKKLKEAKITKGC